MTYSGRIQKGQIILDQPVRLAEGVRVEVEVIVAERPEALSSPCASRIPGQFAGQISLSSNFDTWPEEFQEAWGLKS